MLAFATLGGISSTNQAKAAWAAAFGLGIAMIGVDGQTGVPRFSFGIVHLYDGIDFLVAIVGLFALSEVLIFLEHSGGASDSAKQAQANRPQIAMGRPVASWNLIRYCTPAMARSTVVGFLAGVLPGAGASLGSFFAYATEKQISNKDDTFGKGDPRGVAAPEAGNNAAAGGALVPMLALGRAGVGHHGGFAGGLVVAERDARPAAVHQQPRHRLGPDRGAVHRELHAAGAEPAAGRHLRAAAC